MLIQKVETRNSFNPMTWETIDKLNFYATQHLLIEPWNMSGSNKETFEEFFERFKKQPVIDKSYILYKKKYFEFVEKKRNKARVREKSIASLSMFPRLQSHARKSLKKAEKKKRQEMNKFAVDLQIEQFEKIYYNIKKSDTKYKPVKKSYISGCNVEGKRIILLLDSSESMLHKELVEIIRLSVQTDNVKQNTEKWTKAKQIYR